MRILKLQFTNINSLAGTWQIDFTDPAYVHGGIFAITGPTGAGKSTILDAICLALYGCTPRLSKITAAENELMSRLTAVCSSEVTFQTQAGKYRCTWSQNRARKKSDGKLQQPVHEIVDAVTDRVIESQITKVAAKVFEVTGMTFDQFTRSILLAQGSFATFLQANANERGEVLQQITGAKIYEDISIYVYDRRRKEEAALRELEIEMNGMQTLSEEELEALRAELAALRSKAAALKLRAEEGRAALAWHDSVASLEEALRNAEAEYGRHSTISGEAKPMRDRLEMAERAAALERFFAPVSRLRAEESQLAEKILAFSEKLPGLQRSRGDAATRFEDMRRNLEECRKSLLRESEQWREVRTLDTRIAEMRKRFDETVRRQEEVRGGQKQYRRIIDAQSAVREEIAMGREELRRYFELHAIDASLAESLSAITVMAEGVQSAAAKFSQKRSALQALMEEQQAAGIERDAARRTCVSGTSESVSAAETASKCDARLESILDGRDIAGYRSAHLALMGREQMLDDAIRMWQEMDAMRKAVAALEEKKAALAARSEKGREHVKRSELDEQSWQKEVDHCQETFLLVSAIETLNEQRAHLQDGVPCPLCGSPDHPFAHGQIPAADEKRQALERAKRELKAASEKRQKYTAELGKVDNEIASTGEMADEKARQIAALQKTCDEQCAALQIACEMPAMSAEAGRVRSERMRMERIVAAADAALNEQRQAHQESERVQREAHEAQLRYEKALSRFEQTEHAAGQCEQDCAAAAEELDTVLTKLSAEAARYGVGPANTDTIDALTGELRARRNTWEERSREKETLQARDDAAVSEMKAAEAVLSDLAQQELKAAEAALQCRMECEASESDRRALFGEKDPDEEERQRHETIAEIERALPAYQEEAERCRKDLEGHEKESSLLSERMTECRAEREREEAALASNLAASGFGGEHEFAAARLPDEERKRLRARIDQLRDEGMRLDSLRNEKRKELQSELDRKISGEDRATVARSLSEAEEESTSVLRTAGAYEDRLRQNESQQNLRAQKSKLHDRRKREYLRWNALNELIGSANGKKFQKIAQAITFEMMVAQANGVLKKMSPRYFLVCDHAADLEMNIVDTYQAGEIRTTKNLSGGESFIVSLSLALGLSHMASRNVRVDSLFLDEGFGTLDEEALDTALTALGELKQDGKSIGVISHVSALKDRIGTQILVTPESAGRSSLSGPGCRRIQ